MSKNTNRFFNLANSYPEQLLNAESMQKLNQKQIDFLHERIKLAKNTVLEIGSGSGAFILQLAEANPDTLHIAVEIRYKRSVRTVQKAKKIAINNLLVIRTDANQFWDYLPEESISKFYLNFPDPWEKTRWQKHRMVSPDFLKNLLKFGKKNCHFSFKTDHEEYFKSSKKIIDNNSSFQVFEYSEDLHNSEYNSTNYLTEFERLFQSQQKNIYYLQAKF